MQTLTHITHTIEEETIQTDYPEERVTTIYMNYLKVLPIQSNSSVEII